MPYTVMLTSVGVEMAADMIMRLCESAVHDVRLIAVDRRTDVNARHFADVFACVDSWDPETFARAVADLADAHHADMVLPLVDGDVLALAPHRALFEERGCLLACNRVEIVDVFANKLRAYELFTRVGMPVPDWRAANDREHLVTAVEQMFCLYGEVVVKPASAQSSRGVSVIRNAIHGAQEYLGSREVHMDHDTFMTRFVDVYDSLFPVVVMKRLREPVHDLDVLAWNGEARRVVPRRRRNIAQGHEIVDSPIMRDLGRDVARSLGLSWPVDCDVMFDEAGTPCLLEINPRPSLSAVVSMAAGVPLMDDLISLARGMDLPTLPDPKASLVVPYRTMTTTRVRKGSDQPLTLRCFRPVRPIFLVALILAFGVAAARAEISAGPQFLKPHQAWSKIERNESILIDVRTPAEWRQTGVPREAQRITLSDPRGAAGFVAAVMKAVRGDVHTPVAVICCTGNRSAKAVALLSRAGFKTVYDVVEGVVGNGNDTGWAMRGLPMVACGVCAAEN